MRIIALAAVMFIFAVSASWGSARQVASGSLAWSQGGVTIPSYAFSTLTPGSRAATNFTLRNYGRHSSGKFAIHLTGSPAFSIGSSGCNGKSLPSWKWCRVTVAYAPSKAGATDRAVLTATRKHRTAARLKITGCSADESGRVYWVDDVDESIGTVKEGVFAVGCRTTITTLAKNQSCPTGLAVDGTHAYWADQCDGMVKSVPLGGGAVTTLADDQAAEPDSVAVDGTYVYWTSGDGTVNKVPLGGGSVTTLASGLDDPGPVAVDGTHVYWLSYYDGTVNEVPVGGGDVTTLASGSDEPTWLAVDHTYVYWTSFDDGTVNEVPVGGGDVTILASGQGPSGLAVDGTRVYWTNFYDGTVNEVPVGGGDVTTLAGGQYESFGVEVRGAHLYWADAGSGLSDGTVMEVPLGGGRANVVAAHLNPTAVAVP